MSTKQPPASTTELPSLDGLPEASWRTYLLFHRPEGPKLVELAEGDSVSVGRGSEADVIIDDLGVSRQHARFTREDSVVRVLDLGSRNGTFVRGAAVSTSVSLSAGDVVTFGRTTVSLVFEPPEQAGRLGIASYEELLGRAAEEIARARSGPHRVALALVRKPRVDPQLMPGVRARLRASDVLTAYGKDALLVLMPGVDTNEALTLLEGALSALGPVRVGLAGFPESASSAEELMSQAHEACRLAKDAGPHVVFGAHAREATSTSQPIVHNARMRALYGMIARVARTSATVLVLGETGTGKELVARALHEQSARHAGPFCAINCATIPPTLVESTLFGHERGSFTGAEQLKKGLFEQASTGTVFLDEIGELPLPAQAALLRVLEEHEIVRVGAVKPIAVDVRVVAATHRDLEQMVEAGTFRGDLYHRLNTITLSLPPLRERVDEVVPLAEAFLRELCRAWGRAAAALTPEAIARLESHGWPGNVRELRNAIERALILAPSDIIGSELLPESMRKDPTEAAKASASEPPSSDAFLSMRDERDRILEALRRTDGNQTRAAELLGMPRRTFVYKLRRYGIKKSFERSDD